MITVPPKVYALIDKCIKHLSGIKKTKRSKTKIQALVREHIDCFHQLKSYGLTPEEIAQIRYSYFSKPWQGLAPFCNIGPTDKKEMKAFFDVWQQAATAYLC